MSGWLDGWFSLQGRPPVRGCAMLVVHWSVLAIIGFVVTITLIPVGVIALGFLGITVPSDLIELEIFGVWVPLVGAVSLLAARRVNRWIDAKVGLPAAAATLEDAPALQSRLTEIDASLAPPGPEADRDRK